MDYSSQMASWDESCLGASFVFLGVEVLCLFPDFSMCFPNLLFDFDSGIMIFIVPGVCDRDMSIP